MKRDLELVRRIMLAVEALPTGGQALGRELRIEDVPPAELAGHLKLLIDQGYLEGNADGTLHRLEPGQILVQGISWEGHEFLDSVRDDSIWRQILQRVGGTSATVALHVITQLGDFYIKKRLGIE